MTTVELTWAEMFLASQAASMRRLHAMKLGIRGKHGASEQVGDELDFFSCQGEMATAKFCNLFWGGLVGDYDSADVGGLVEVRTCRRPWHCLILHHGDRDDAPFVLVCAKDAPTFKLCGWLFGRDGKHEEYWKDPAGGRPAFFVPADVLRPMPELLQWVADQQAAASSIA